jgi:hypothetical protein
MYITLHLLDDMLNFKTNIVKQFSFYYGLIVFVAFNKSNGFSLKMFTTTLYVYFGLLLISLLIPDTYYVLQNKIINTRSDGMSYEYVIGASRGASILAPEPSYFGVILSFLVILNQSFFDKRSINNKVFLLNLSAIIFCVVQNKSGTAMMLLATYLFWFFLYKTSKIVKLLVLSFSFLIFSTILSTINFEELASWGRSFDIVYKLAENRDSLYEDESMFVRLNDFYTGFISTYYYPLGVGCGELDTSLQYLSTKYSFIEVGRKALVSSFSLGLAAFGFPFFVFILYMYGRSNVFFIKKLFSFLYIALFVSFGFPPAWVLLSNNLINEKNV